MATAHVIRAMARSDWPSVAAVYAQGIEGGDATFEVAVPDWSEWHAGHLPDCRLVAEAGVEVLGWAALSPTSRREVYRGVAESSVYVGNDAQSKGVGSALLTALVECSEESGIWTLQAGIFPENETSVRLHERHGFRIVGTRERIGSSNGRWRDVLLLERRSPLIGR